MAGVFTFFVVKLILIYFYLNEIYCNSSEDEWTNENLRCLFLNQDQFECTSSQTDILRLHLAQFLNSFESNIQATLKQNQLHLLPSRHLEKLPPTFLHLLPAGSLRNISGESLARWALQDKTFGSVSFWDRITLEITDPEKSKAFLSSIANSRKSPLQAQTLGLALTRWWNGYSNFEDFQQALAAGAFQRLPPSWLMASLAKNDMEKFIYHLRYWKSVKPDSRRPFADLTQAQLRVWAHILLTHPKYENLKKWDSHLISSQGFFLKGATPLELRELKHFNTEEFTLLVRQAAFDKSQIRTAYEAMINLKKLNKNSLNELILMIPFLSADQVRKLYNISEPNVFTKLINSPENIVSITSPITALEISKCLENESLRRWTNLQMPSKWERLHTLGPWIFTKPISQIRSSLSSSGSFPLTSSVLRSLHSRHLSFGQVRALTQDGKDLSLNSDLLSLKEYAQALPLSKVAFIPEGKLSQNSRETLSLYLTKKNSAMSAALATITHGNIAAGIDVLRAQPRLLMSPRILEILPAKDLKIISKYMRQVFSRPHPILAEHPLPLLSFALSHGRENSEWTSEEHFLLSPLISGISCEQIEKIRTIDFIPFISSYNTIRRTFSLPFPKATQNCWKDFLENYLLMKMKLNRPCSNKPLLSLLNSAEIRAIGGFVFTSISKKAIAAADDNTLEILEEIGKVPHEELLVSAKILHIKELANLFAEKMSQEYEDRLNASATLRLGQLVHFLDSKFLKMIEYKAFRLWVESQEPKSGGRSLCHGRVHALPSWTELIIGTFGTPSSWSTELLFTLGDMLLALPERILEQIPTLIWRSGIDILSEQSFYLRPIRSSINTENNINFYELCMAHLETQEARDVYKKSMIGLARRQLDIASAQIASLSTQDTHIFFKRGFKQKEQLNDILREISNSSLQTFINGPNTLSPDNLSTISTTSDFANPSSTLKTESLSTTTKIESTEIVTETTSFVDFSTTSGDKFQDNFNKSLIDNPDPTTPVMDIYIDKDEQSIEDDSRENFMINNESSESFSEEQNINNKSENKLSNGKMNLTHESNLSLLDSSENDFETNYLENLSLENSTLNLENTTFVVRNDGGKVHSSTPEKIGDYLITLVDLFSRNNKNISKRSLTMIENEPNLYGKTLQGRVLKTERGEPILSPTALPDIPSTQLRAPSQETAHFFSNAIPNKLQRIKGINCGGIRTLGPLAAFGLNGLDIVTLADSGELNDCLETLGQLEMLPFPLRNLIISQVKPDILKLEFETLGGLLEAVNEKTIFKLNMSIYNLKTMDRLQSISSIVQNPEILNKVARNFINENPHASSELSSMGQSVITMSLGFGIGCALTSSERKEWMNEEFLPRNWPSARYSLCPSVECLLDFALRRITTLPETWTALDLYALGILAAGLPEDIWMKIPPDAYSGLTPQTLICIPKQIHKILLRTHLLSFSSATGLKVAWLTKRRLPFEEVSLIDMDELPEQLLQIVPTNKSSFSTPSDIIKYLIFYIYFFIKFGL